MFGLAAYFLICAGLGVAVFRKPAAIVAAVLTVQVLDFWGMLSSPLIARYSLATNIYLVVLVGFAALKATLTSKSTPKGPMSGRILVAAFWAYAFASLAWTPALEAGLGEWQKYLPYMVLTLATPLCLRSRDDLHEGLLSLLFFGTALVILSAIFVKWEDRYMVSLWDPSQRYWNALAFAQLAGFVTLTAVLLDLPRNASWTALRVAAIVACLVLTVKSGTRGQFGVMILLPIALLPLCVRMKKVGNYFLLALLASVVIGGGLWTLSAFGEQDVAGRWSSQTLDSDLAMRWASAGRLLEVWWSQSHTNPAVLLGGLGNSASFSEEIIGFYPHVLLVEILAEEGMIGTLLFGAILTLFWRRFRSALRQTATGTSQRNAVVTIAAFFFFTFILSFKQGSLAGYTADLFFPFLYLEQYLRLSREKPASRTPPKTFSFLN